jgi:hypothetical protein
MVKVHAHTTISPCYAFTLEVSIVPFIHPMKIKLRMWCDLSLSLYPKVSLKKRHGLCKRRRRRRRRRRRHMLKA